MVRESLIFTLLVLIIVLLLVFNKLLNTNINRELEAINHSSMCEFQMTGGGRGVWVRVDVNKGIIRAFF